MESMGPKKLLILYILEVLKKYSDENHKLTQKDVIKHIKEEYNMVCERKAIGRNISYLIEFGYEIETKADNNEGIWLVSREFEEAELRLLIDSIYATKFLNDKYANKLICKLNKKGSKYFKNRTKHIINISEQNRSHNASLFYNIDIIDEAIDSSYKISFKYNMYGADKKLHIKKEHTVSPYQMIINNGRYYLIGNIEKYNNIVNFRIDLITDIKIIKNSVIKPIKNIEDHKNGLDLNKISIESPYMFSGKTSHIKIKTNIAMIGSFIDWFGEEIKIIKLDNNNVEIRFIANINAMRYWILQYGLHIEVLKPEKLRQLHIEDIKEIYKKYEEVK